MKFQAHVRDLTLKGLGVVDGPDGMIFFVQGAWPGDEGEFEILSREKRYGFAKTVALSKPSPFRVSPECPHQGFEVHQCGGCPWMIASSENQTLAKESLLNSALQRAGLLECIVEKRPLLTSPSRTAWRNRAQLKTDGVQIGYVSAQSHSLAPIEDCLILEPHPRELLQKLKSALPNPDWAPKPPYHWNFIDIDDELSFAQISLNARRPFKQGNTYQNQTMRKWIQSELAQLIAKESSLTESTVLELFCGSGNFTEILSELGFANILAVESSSESLLQLQSKDLKNVQTQACNLFQPRNWGQLKTNRKQVEILLMDPPREGFEGIDKFLESFSNLRHIFSISCDVNTFCRDAKKLKEKSWTLRTLQPIDLFPNTPHIEILSHWCRT